MRVSTIFPGAGSNWFVLAVRGLAMLARNEHLCASAAIAGEMHAHAVSLRRVLAQLVHAGLVEAREGREGGYRLLKAPESITLADVYAAVQPAPPHYPAVSASSCPGEAAMREALGEALSTVEAQAVAALRCYTLADLMRRAGCLQDLAGA